MSLRKNAFPSRGLAAAAFAGIVAACDNPQPRPSGVVGPSPPGPSPQPFVVRLEISGPDSIAPGQSAQFTATSHLSDGTSETPTNVRWSSYARLFRVDASGLATAGDRIGEDSVMAEVGERNGLRRSFKEIAILPEGTFRVVGVVTEQAPPMTPVFGARVEVAGAMATAVTDYEGRYRLYPVPAAADIRVTRDGYQALVQGVRLHGHATQNFHLALSGMRLDLGGPYTLTIDTTCATPLPADLRQRRYPAFLRQSGPTVDVVLTESERFTVNGVGRGDRFSGRVDAAGATFDVGGGFYNYYGRYDPSTYPNIVERLPDGSILTVDGTAVTRGSAAGLSGDLQGFVTSYDPVTR
jgi:hypothetical protein